ncbi:MAG: RsmE family RNA methyltransferase, partial [Bacteroidota bacterium]
ELKTTCLPVKPTMILIGPEGDFTANEISVAKKNNFQPISLGNSRLRTETAGVVACTIINMINS